MIVNDVTGRRVMMFDSTLKNVTVVADSTGATANAYAARLGGLIAYRGDSTLFVDPASLSMLVIDANGRIVRTLAAPQPSEINNLIGGPFGTPGFDARGRLVYRSSIRSQLPIMPGQVRPSPDSALIVRFDFTSRTVDTVVKIGIPQIRYSVDVTEIKNRAVNMMSMLVSPIPWTDDWALLSDGTIAVVRGRDYRVDLIGPDDKVTSAPKLAFEWQRLTDEDKAAIIDSTKKEIEKQRAAQVARSALAATRDSSARAGTRDSGSGTSGAPTRVGPRPPQFVSLDEMPDYRPAFRQGAARGDEDGNLWIRTSKVFNGGPVYDVINDKGALVDRVQVPPGRVIAGFGPGGVVYMGVVDGNITRLERARMH